MIHRHALILGRGDPGILDVFKRLGRGAAGFLAGGPVGAAAGFLAPTGGARVGLPSPNQVGGPGTIGPGLVPGGGRIPILSVPGVRGIFEQLIPGGATGLQLAGAGLAGAVPAHGHPGGCPSGFHPNKSTYMTQAGLVAKGTRCVRNRRRNLSNGRANTRALRRMAAWDKQERRLGKTLKAIARGR